MEVSRQAIEIRPFASTDIDAAAALLAERHRRHRAAMPAMDQAFETQAGTRPQIQALLADATAAGWVATTGGRVAGYLIGVAKDASVWGRNVWVEAPGHAAEDPDLVRRLYAVAAGQWVGEGRTNHHVLVPATDAGLVDAWFRLDFGQQHLHAAIEAPPPSFGVVPRSELTIRLARPEDITPLIELERVLPLHLAESPVFSRLPVSTPDEIVAELEADIVDPKYHFLVAEHEGRAIATAIGCSLEVSTGATGLNRPPHAGYLAYAAVLPEARGLGAGRALGEAVLVWARDAGYTWIATDWRSTNLEADRAWLGMGFRPTFRRLHRSII